MGLSRRRRRQPKTEERQAPQMATPSAAHGRGKNRSLASTGARPTADGKGASFLRVLRWQRREPVMPTRTRRGQRPPFVFLLFFKSFFILLSFLSFPLLNLLAIQNALCVTTFSLLLPAVSCLPSLFAPPQQLASRSVSDEAIARTCVQCGSSDYPLATFLFSNKHAERTRTRKCPPPPPLNKILNSRETPQCS